MQRYFVHNKAKSPINTWHDESHVVQHICKVCCSVLQCVAVCCSVLQCVAVWCRWISCGATYATSSETWPIRAQHDSFIWPDACTFMWHALCIWAIPHLYGTWIIHLVCATTGLVTRHCESWLVTLVCATTHIVSHGSSHTNVTSHDSQCDESWLICVEHTSIWPDVCTFMCDIPHLYGTWIIYMGHESFIWDINHLYGTWIIYMGHESFIWDMNHLYGTWIIFMGHEPFI